MLPTIGRVVHYQARGSADGKFLPEPRAAIVTGVASPRHGDVGQRLDLFVITPTGSFHDSGIPFAEEPTPGHWNWPPRVAERPVDGL